MTDGGWQTADGRWQMEAGRKTEDGGRRNARWAVKVAVGMMKTAEVEAQFIDKGSSPS